MQTGVFNVLKVSSDYKNHKHYNKALNQKRAIFAHFFKLRGSYKRVATNCEKRVSATRRILREKQIIKEINTETRKMAMENVSHPHTPTMTTTSPAGGATTAIDRLSQELWLYLLQVKKLLFSWYFLRE
jgi:hypothetical protein